LRAGLSRNQAGLSRKRAQLSRNQAGLSRKRAELCRNQAELSRLRALQAQKLIMLTASSASARYGRLTVPRSFGKLMRLDKGTRRPNAPHVEFAMGCGGTG
jgi:hypothetical protein